MRYTIDSIGQTLDNHILTQTKWEMEMSVDVEYLKTKLVVGNGELPLTEQVHICNAWIASANKLLWIIVTALVGQMVIIILFALAAGLMIFMADK